MTKDQIENHLGYEQAKFAYSRPNAKLRTMTGETIGAIRHSAEKYSGQTKVGLTLASDDIGEYWHYHETNGRGHCTRRAHTSAIVGLA